MHYTARAVKMGDTIFFEILRIPYTHSGPVSSYNAMDKVVSKYFFQKK